MTVSIEEVPWWTHKAGHILMWSEGTGDNTAWSQTICGRMSCGYYCAVPDRPKRVCPKCRAELKKAVSVNRPKVIP